MTSKLKYSTKDYSFVKGDKGKEMLRFTACWSQDHPIAGEQGMEVSGCLAHYYRGELHWKFPLNYYGMARKQVHSCKSGTYKGILECLRKYKYIHKLQSVLDNLELDEKLEGDLNEVEL